MTPSNIHQLTVKELRSLCHDPMMLVLIVYAFSLAVYAAATAMPESLHHAPIAVVDEDRSQLSHRLVDAFYPPYFIRPQRISPTQMDQRMDAGLDTFAIHIPPDFERDVLARRSPTLQLNVDATRMSQALTGTGYIETIISTETAAFLHGYRAPQSAPATLALRSRFNPELNKSWFGSVMEIINNVTMLSIVLAGAALIREREHGTIEHLLVMPVTPFEIMTGKILAMAIVVLVATGASLTGVVNGLLGVPLQGSLALFLLGTALHLYATTSLGIFLATLARSMPQFGLLLMLVLLPLQILSGTTTPRESMPDAVQWLMLGAPNTHFVMLAQAILYRGAGFSVVWPQLIALLLIGSVLFSLSLSRFRKTLNSIG
nr:ABC transporter permease [uncultured Desulfuromonas sp.]